jgi:hypothetical protein
MNSTVRGNLFGLAGACVLDWQNEVIKKLKSQNIPVFNNQNPVFDLFSQNEEIHNEIYFTKTHCHTIFGVLLENFPSATSCQLLIEYVQFFGQNSILIIPDYKDLTNPEKGSKDFNHQKFVNIQRVYLRQLAKKYGGNVFSSLEEGLDYAIDLYLRWSNTVITLGACGNSTWRKDYFSQLTNKFNHFNPQKDDWTPQMAIDEEIAKQFSNVLFINLNDLPQDQITLGLVSQDETWFLSDKKRNLILVYNPELDIQCANLLNLYDNIFDYLDSRKQLMKKIVLSNSKNPFFKWVKTMEEGIVELNQLIVNLEKSNEFFALK